jgi:hypothetical protein
VPRPEHGYGDALRDGGVVRPVSFPRVDGMMEGSAPAGTLVDAMEPFPGCAERLRGRPPQAPPLSLRGDSRAYCVAGISFTPA